MSARLATVDDVPALVAMRRQLMEHFGWVEASDPSGDAWVTRLDHVLRDGIPAGTVVASVVPNELGELVASGVATIIDQLPSPALPHGQYAHISSVFTEPDHRGRGFGRVVVEVLIDALR
ncbi:MAG: GNAT family N-acetyltransferase, partial [Thermoleophilia bacterium]|nr:GNAT family N-acetyltransferase [Thermoleophilia bacterium]